MKTGTFLIIAVFFFGPDAFAQERRPVEIIKISSALQGYCDLAPCMDVEYKNISEKEIVGLEFSAIFIDAVGDTHKAISYFTSYGSRWGKPVKPGTKSHGVWSIWIYRNFFHSIHKDVRVSVHKVLFKDGTTWEEPKD